MTYQRPRSGIFAKVNGVEYEANSYPQDGQVVLFSRAERNPDVTLFQWNAAFNAWLATVPTSTCDRLVEVTSLADYQGLACQVISIGPDGATGLYYLGDEKAQAAEFGFVQTDPGTWANTVNIYHLHRYREHHSDLLFEDWWKANHPGAAPTEGRGRGGG